MTDDPFDPPENAPLYESEPGFGSLWQAYRIHADRLELDTQVFGTVTVPFDAVQAVRTRPRFVILDLLRGDYGLGDLLRAPKLDLADVHEHVVIEKDGFWRQFRITPDDPDAFVAAFHEAFAAWKARGNDLD